MRSSQVRNWLLVLFMALPCALSAQITQVPFDQCVYRLGDNPAWAAVNVDPSGWKPYTDYHETGDAWVLWVRCRASFDTSGIEHPVVVAGRDGPEQSDLFVDGQPATRFRDESLPVWTYAPSPEAGHPTRTFAVRVVQKLLVPGNSPGRPVYLDFGDGPRLLEYSEANLGTRLRSFVPTYSAYLIIGAAGLFLVGLFLFDRSQKAAFWLGIYCCCVCITRINLMVADLSRNGLSLLLDGVLFGLSMFESWALVRVNFALAQRRVPILYWLVFAAWVFIFVGSVLPVYAPRTMGIAALNFCAGQMLQAHLVHLGICMYGPVRCFLALDRLRGHMRMVAALCAVWGVIEGWFQLQQVIFDREYLVQTGCRTGCRWPSPHW